MIYQSNRAETFRVDSILIKEQFLFFKFCLKMLTRSSKMQGKKTYEKTLICQNCKLMLYALISLDYHAINHKTPIIHLSTHNSMLEKYQNIKNKLKWNITYLRIQAKTENRLENGQMQGSSPLIFFFSLFLFFPFSSSFLLSLALSYALSLYGCRDKALENAQSLLAINSCHIH